MSEVVQEVEVDLDGFPMVGAGSVAIPAEASIFKRDSGIVEFPEATTPTGKKAEEVKPTEVKAPAAEQQASLLNEILDGASKEEIELAPEGTEPPAKTGKPKIDKSAMIEYLKTKIESKDFTTFDDYDEKAPLEDYLGGLSNKDLSALVDENLKLKEESLKQAVPKQFYNSLPGDFKAAYDYIANGGQDLKGLYRALSEVREIKELDPSKEEDQAEIVQEYLKNANPDWSKEEVKEQVEEWKEGALLAKKASSFKPKLDRIKEDYVRYQLEEQQEFNKQRQEAAQTYIKNVTEALRPGEINGLKLDDKTQYGLYEGLTQAKFQSISGGNTNELGHLLEKYQYKEPNYALISEVLWHLKDPEAYRNALIQKGKNAQTEEISKKLKQTQGDRSSSSSFDEGGDATRTPGARKIQRQGGNPFKR